MYAEKFPRKLEKNFATIIGRKALRNSAKKNARKATSIRESMQYKYKGTRRESMLKKVSRS